MINLILLYNGEIWGPTLCTQGNLDKMLENNTNKTALYYKFSHEKIHMKWSKCILGLGSGSTNIKVSGELGRYPLIMEIMCTVVKH